MCQTEAAAAGRQLNPPPASCKAPAGPAELSDCTVPSCQGDSLHLLQGESPGTEQVPGQQEDPGSSGAVLGPALNRSALCAWESSPEKTSIHVESCSA